MSAGHDGQDLRFRSRRRLALALLAVFPFLLLGCGEDSAGPEKRTSLEDVVKGDSEVGGATVGEDVTVSATVTEVINTHSFVLSGDDVGGEGLLVVSPDEAKVNEGDTVRVQGPVRIFYYVKFEDRFRLGARHRYDDYDGDKFIVAVSIEKTSSVR